jgi:hypothetical protein
MACLAVGGRSGDVLTLVMPSVHALPFGPLVPIRPRPFPLPLTRPHNSVPTICNANESPFWKLHRLLITRRQCSPYIHRSVPCCAVVLIARNRYQTCSRTLSASSPQPNHVYPDLCCHRYIHHHQPINNPAAHPTLTIMSKVLKVDPHRHQPCLLAKFSLFHGRDSIAYWLSQAELLVTRTKKKNLLD